MKDKLLDYIDDNLSIKERKTIKEHLKTCEECNTEYVEIKSTIDYITDNSNKIDTNNELNLNPNKVKIKSIGLFTRTGLIAIILSLMLVVTAFATDIFGFMKWWKKSSEIDISAWEKLIENGVGQKLDISVTDNDIKVTAEGIIADNLNTIILLRIEDLNGKIRFTPLRGGSPYEESLTVGGDIPNLHEDIPPIVNYHPLYAEEENTVRLMVKTDSMYKDEGNVEIHLNRLVSMINESEESVVEVSGNWDMTIPAKKIESKLYEIDETIDLDGNELIIRAITIAPTATRIEYSFETYNEEDRYYIDDITFLIEDGMKTYGRSELSSETKAYSSGRKYLRREFDIQSIYLEDPKDIDVIVNTYRYTTRGLKKYDIDWNNLPQVIEYDNSKITVEDIKYEDNNAEIIIKEDESKDREYIWSNIRWKSDETQRSYGFYVTYLEYETRDSKGRVKNLEDKFWTDEFYNFVFSQKLTLDKEGLDSGKLCIEGQDYIKYSNIRKNIKLR